MIADTALLTAIRDASRSAEPDDAPRILRALADRIADGSLDADRWGPVLELAADDLDHGRSYSALLTVASRAAIALEAEGAGA